MSFCPALRKPKIWKKGKIPARHCNHPKDRCFGDRPRQEGGFSTHIKHLLGTQTARAEERTPDGLSQARHLSSVCGEACESHFAQQICRH